MTTKKETVSNTLDDLAIATDLLLSAKAGVRSYAIAITETATPEIRKVLKKQLDTAIEMHGKIAQYMINNEMYHAYNINDQIEHDIEKADRALELIK